MFNKKESRNNMKQDEREVREKIKKANNCFVWCMIDGVDVGEYFKTTKTDIWFYVRKYIRNNKENTDFENLNSTIVLREDGDLYVN